VISIIMAIVVGLVHLFEFQSPTGIQRNCYIALYALFGVDVALIVSVPYGDSEELLPGVGRRDNLKPYPAFQSPTGIQRNCYGRQHGHQRIHRPTRQRFQSPTGIQRNCYAGETWCSAQPVNIGFLFQSPTGIQRNCYLRGQANADIGSRARVCFSPLRGFRGIVTNR
jgi:hypothetical protein